MNSEKTDIPDKETQEKEAAYRRTADAVRMRSEEGKLIQREEIVQILRERRGEPSEYSYEEDILMEAMNRNEDLTSIPGQDGLPRYYSTIYMIEAYAQLLVRKEGNPLLMIAETVRENSKIYPRPIRRDIFKNEPFELNEEEISTCLQKMREEDQYKDIAQTTTSEGTVFLYSTLHLEPDYASMLAEWVDVGQYRNP
jgi:hypothetical protein